MIDHLIFLKAEDVIRYYHPQNGSICCQLILGGKFYIIVEMAVPVITYKPFHKWRNLSLKQTQSKVSNLIAAYPFSHGLKVRQKRFAKCINLLMERCKTRPRIIGCNLPNICPFIFFFRPTSSLLCLKRPTQSECLDTKLSTRS